MAEEGWIAKGLEETSGLMNVFVPFNVVMVSGSMYMSKLIKLYSLNICTSLCFNYSLVM